MPRTKKNQKCYVVLSKVKRYRYGAFPYTEDGRTLAEEYVKKMTKQYNEDFYIAEK